MSLRPVDAMEPPIKTSSWVAIKVFAEQYVTISIYTTVCFLVVKLQVDTEGPLSSNTQREYLYYFQASRHMCPIVN